MLLNNKRILIIKPSSLGDIVHTLPVAHAIKRCFPNCFIGWIAQQPFAPLLQADDSIDAVHPIQIPSTSDPQAGRWALPKAFKATINTLQKLHREFQQKPYDLILDLHASFRSGLLGRTNPGGRRVGFSRAKELNTFFQEHLIDIPKTTEHAQDKNLLFCTYLGIRAADEDFHLCTGEKDRRALQQFLQSYRVTDTSPLIYANPAARWQTKFWPIEHWAALTDKLHQQGLPVVFGGSPQDTEYITSIARLMKTDPIIAAGRLTLPQSAALIQHASLYIGLDSGPMHIAALAHTPVVALFGPTHPNRVGPYSTEGSEHRIVQADELDCLECRKRSCSHLSCMRKISPEMVYEAAIAFLHLRLTPEGAHPKCSRTAEQTPMTYHEG
ncbi:glycosyltransferase family 9 protein [Desulfobulbus sp. US2]|nr:glycosyltransferase family 9 protein [Desulfobulbus sp. US4]MCW5204957.1 glycosyltransferase family 9 protein [Desulfobulbus sp. N2]MCW5207843.1 glycosyltransferase family 9 protein [Desulfobulbus sp. US2]